VVRSRNHGCYEKATMLFVIIELLFTASNIEVLGIAQKFFYGKFISPATVTPTEVCT
jgi:hypothetical protein